VTEPSQHVIELDMRESDISEEHKRLKKSHWTDLLTSGPLSEVQIQNEPLAEALEPAS
jgi:hypothetical protein